MYSFFIYPSLKASNNSKYEVLFNDATNALYQSGDFTAPTDEVEK